jgi:hypothetical protein
VRDRSPNYNPGFAVTVSVAFYEIMNEKVIKSRKHQAKEMIIYNLD